MASARHIGIGRVNFLWYIVPIVPILVLAHASLMNWLPGWGLMFAIFTLCMWLFSLLFTLFAVATRPGKEPSS